ncbi:MAG: hypothetical protein Q7K57_49295 [Burkholderiaceae bacterium]|nr:hypothetical protein [Burkholderiaceae bacterium]
MGRGIGQAERALWLMLRNDGGIWTVNQITHHWRPTFSTEEVQWMLDAMTDARLVEKRGQLHAVYCVSSTCIPLPGLSLTREAA